VGKVSRAMNKAETGIKSDGSTHTSFHEQKERQKTVIEIKKEPKETTIAPPFTPAGGNLEEWDERLIIATENLSGVAENFRKLRTQILHPETGRRARSIMVLSADPQEGKSFVCANLGVSFAHGVGMQALMIDCDLRRPSLQRLFGLKSSKGLVNYLRDEEDLSRLILATGLPKLSIIPSGSPPDNPSELLTSVKMTTMVEELTDRYHDDGLILLDTPPFLAASETVFLAQLVDKVVVVVRWGKSGRENIKKMVDQIGREKIIGVVFNAFEMNILDKKVQGVGYHDYYTEAYY
jgi:exopolysaccharide/PEP-CTERM locus tyrosine autokinase